MGNIFPFQRHSNDNVENIDNNSTTSYRFPPKSGTYFAPHFMMAGEKFDNMNPETFLFGENNDLNYLPSKPVPFPYASSKNSEPSRTVRSLVHLRKDTLKLAREEKEDELDDLYGVEFVFDTDVACSIHVYLIATEQLTQQHLKYTTRKPEYTSEGVSFNRGTGQTFKSPLLINPEDFQPSELNYSPGSGEIPLVIHITVDEPDFVGQSEATLAGIEKLSDGTFSMKFMKQKLMVDGFCFVTQEIYGIENKAENGREDAEELDEDNIECVICMSNLRDTIMLPCRHLCLCNVCGEQMRTKSSRCPICRANFHALLQIKTVRTGASDDTLEEVPLIEALNGFNPLNNDTDRHSSLKRHISLNRSGKRSQSSKSLRNTSDTQQQRNCKSSICLRGERVDEDVQDEKENAERQTSVVMDEMAVDASLPGTPMDSDTSNDSPVSLPPVANLSGAGFTSLFTNGRLSATRAQITSNVRVDASVDKNTPIVLPPLKIPPTNIDEDSEDETITMHAEEGSADESSIQEQSLSHKSPSKKDSQRKTSEESSQRSPNKKDSQRKTSKETSQRSIKKHLEGDEEISPSKQQKDSRPKKQNSTPRDAAEMLSSNQQSWSPHVVERQQDDVMVEMQNQEMASSGDVMMTSGDNHVGWGEDERA